jgi:hypothetical protein
MPIKLQPKDVGSKNQEVRGRLPNMLRHFVALACTWQIKVCYIDLISILWWTGTLYLQA